MPKQILDETKNVTSGFFNGIVNENGTIDRTYDANDISSMFDGLITDGIFGTIGDEFACSAGNSASQLIVKVGTGKAWFNKTWISNNEEQTIELDAAPPVGQTRIDAIVIDIDKTQATRKNTIQYIPGVASANATPPELVSGGTESNPHKQYALWHITVRSGITDSRELVIKDARIVNRIIGPAIKIDTKPFLEGWEVQFQNLYVDQEKALKTMLETLGDTSESRVESEISDWKKTQQASFETWFGALEATLSDNVAANLTTKLEREKINRLLQNGFEQCKKEISEDGKIITSYNQDDTTYYKITKKFNDDFSELTTTLSDKQNVEKAKMTKTFDSTGSIINTTVEYKY